MPQPKELNFDLIGVSPISFSRPVQSERNTGEAHDVFEQRTWPEHLHCNTKGEVFIPPMAIKNALTSCAKYLAESVPGKGKATWTKHFDAGILVMDPMMLLTEKGEQITRDMVIAKKWFDRLFLPSDGRRGGGSRVWKSYPTIPEGWKTRARIIAIDPLLVDKPEKVLEYVQQAGTFIGMGRFRPRNGGFYGRWTVKTD